MTPRTWSASRVTNGALCALPIAVAACAATIRPPVFAEADGYRTGPQGQAAEKFAPQAFAHAGTIQQRAEQLFADDNTQAAELTGTHAVAAYNKAFMLARLAQASTRQLNAHAQLAAAQRELTMLDSQHATLLAEAAALEMKVNVVRDASPLVANAPADNEREAARRATVRALALQARMLCVGAQMLSPQKAELPRLFGDIDRLEKAVSAGGAAPIDAAISARSKCLEALSSVRAPSTAQAPENGAADRLLTQLSAAGHLPHRDDRGVIVTLYEVERGGKLTEPAQAALRDLSNVVKSNPSFPLMIAGHAVGRDAPERSRARAELVATELGSLGVSGARAIAAGAALPLAEETATSAKKINDRVEIVFIAKAW